MGTIRFSHEFNAQHHDPRPGPLRQLHRNGRITEARLPGSRDAADAARPDPGDAQPDRRRERRRASSRTSSTVTFAFKTGTLGHTARLGHRARPRDVRPDPRACTPASRRRASSPEPARRVRRHARTSPRRSNDRQHVRGVRAGHDARSGTSRWTWPDSGGTASTWTTSRRSPPACSSPAWTRCRTGARAIAYKPRSNGTIYFDAGTSSNPSAEALSLSAANVNLDPEKNRTFEVGTKWDLLDNSSRCAPRSSARRRSTRASRTRTIRLSTSSPASQRVQGGEIEASGTITTLLEHQPRLLLSRRAADRVAVLPAVRGRAARERSRKHVPPLEHVQAAVGAPARGGRQLRRSADGQHDRAVRSGHGPAQGGSRAYWSRSTPCCAGRSPRR